MPDHIHMLVSIPLKYSISQFMGYLKGKSALSIEISLQKEGYEVKTAGSIVEAEQVMREFIPEMLFCDINLPDGSGLDFIKSIREKTNAHLIMLTALDQETDMVMGYEAGADDYIAKPFSLSVLIMKINAYFRKESANENRIIKAGNVKVDKGAMKVYVNEEEISLTKNEWKLLLLFMENPNIILSKEQILEKIFDIDSEFVDENTVAVNIARLRKKIDTGDDGKRLIKNVRGLGYVWNVKN